MKTWTKTQTAKLKWTLKDNPVLKTYVVDVYISLTIAACVIGFVLGYVIGYGKGCG